MTSILVAFHFGLVSYTDIINLFILTNVGFLIHDLYVKILRVFYRVFLYARLNKRDLLWYMYGVVHLSVRLKTFSHNSFDFHLILTKLDMHTCWIIRCMFYVKHLTPGHQGGPFKGKMLSNFKTIYLLYFLSKNKSIV